MIKEIIVIFLFFIISSKINFISVYNMRLLLIMLNAFILFQFSMFFYYLRIDE
ncbi:hypothetical protein IYC_00957 [Clostridium sporogenes PA 3679]|nr:hypothetical protein IYC_00957 [Clostridium sporogenes PA 3679]